MSRTLSNETSSLIELLYKPDSFWERSAKRKRAALALIGRSGEPAAIPDIAPFLLDSNRDVAIATANAAGEMLVTLSPGEFPWFDQLMRESSPYRWRYPSAWAQLRPDQFDSLEKLGKGSIFAFGMAASHYSGYVREEALKRLGKVKNGMELPFLLLRPNDWVAEIRDVAYRLLRERLTKDYARFFVSNIVLVDRLRHTRQGSQLGIADDIESVLRSDDGQEAINAGLGSHNKHVKRSCYKLALASNVPVQQLLVEKALRESDPVIRLWGAEKLSSIVDAEFASRLLSRTRTDRFASVRRKALQVSAGRFPELARPWLDQELMDAHSGIRGYAQFQLGKLGVDLRRFYLEALAKSDRTSLYPAISGVGEAGTASDAGLVVSYASDEIPRIRRAAVRTLTRLCAGEFVDVFEGRLSDYAPSVSRQAMQGLVKARHLVGGERIWNVFVSSSEVHVRRNALFFVARLSKWESIGGLVEALGISNGAVKDLAGSYIRRWHSRLNDSFMSPTEPQMEGLTAALTRSGPTMDRLMREHIQFATRGL